MKRIILSLLTVLLAFGTLGLSGCEKAPETYTDILAAYTIVRPEMADGELADVVEVLYSTLNMSNLPVTDLAEPAAQEIILGDADREEAKAAIEELKNAHDYHPCDYMVKVLENNIVVASESQSGAAAGVAYLMENILPATAEDYPVGYTYTYRIAPAEEGEVPLKYADRYLVWNEEFDEWDKDEWKLSLGGNSIADWYKGSDIRVEDGVLKMERRKPEGDILRGELPWMTTLGTFCYNYGYLEMRAKLPLLDTTPALWLMTQSNMKSEPYHMEIDSHESVRNATGFSVTLWKSYYHTVLGERAVNYVPSPWSEALYIPEHETMGEQWHIYGFGWDEEKMWVTMDGDLLWTQYITEEYSWSDVEGVACLHEPMFILFSNNGPMSNMADGTLSSFQVDWIRLYQKAYEGRAIWNPGREPWDRDYVTDTSVITTQVDWEAVIKAADGE